MGHKFNIRADRFFLIVYINLVCLIYGMPKSWKDWNRALTLYDQQSTILNYHFACSMLAKKKTVDRPVPYNKPDCLSFVSRTQAFKDPPFRYREKSWMIWRLINLIMMSLQLRWLMLKLRNVSATQTIRARFPNYNIF